MLRLKVTNEDGTIHIIPIEEESISKNDLYLEYLNDCLEMEEWVVLIGEEEQSKKSFYHQEEPDEGNYDEYEYKSQD